MLNAARRRRWHCGCNTGFQTTAVTERSTLLAARIFKATGAAGLSELPFGGILPTSRPAGSIFRTQYEYVGSSWGGVVRLENKDSTRVAT